MHVFLELGIPNIFLVIFLNSCDRTLNFENKKQMKFGVFKCLYSAGSSENTLIRILELNKLYIKYKKIPTFLFPANACPKI